MLASATWCETVMNSAPFAVFWSTPSESLFLPLAILQETSKTKVTRTACLRNQGRARTCPIPRPPRTPSLAPQGHGLSFSDPVRLGPDHVAEMERNRLWHDLPVECLPSMLPPPLEGFWEAPDGQRATSRFLTVR